MSSPLVQNQIPSPNARQIDSSSNVYLEIIDTDNNLVANSVEIYVNGVIAWQTELQQTGFAVTRTVITNGHSYDINPDVDLPQNKQTEIKFVADDGSNFVTDSYNFWVEDLLLQKDSATTNAGFEDSLEILDPPKLKQVIPFAGFEDFGIVQIFDDVPPVLQNLNPANAATGVARNVNIVLELIDVGTGVDVNSVILTVEGVVAWQNDTQQAGYTVTKTPITNGFEYSINPDVDLPESNSIQVDVFAQDLAVTPNILNTSYSFITSGTLPGYGFRDPIPGQTHVGVTQNLILEILDPESGINAGVTVLTVGGVIAWQSSANQNSFITTVTAISGGFRYEINPPSSLPAGLTTLAVYAENTAEITGVLSDSYTFDVFLDVKPPLILNINPPPGSEDVLRSRSVSFSIEDDADVDLAETRIFVRDDLVFDGAIDQFSTGWTSSSKIVNTNNGFDFIIVPDVSFRWDSGETVNVSVNTKDTSALATRESWFFIVEGVAFPFSIHRFILRSIREMDSRSPGLIELISTLAGGLNDTWEQKVFDRCSVLPEMFDPEKIPDQWLPWLKSIVGFTRDMSFQATEDELRKIIGNASQYWQHKTAEQALIFAIRMITGNRFKIRNYFDFRMMASNAPNLTEAIFVSELLEDFDPDVIDFPSVSPSGSDIRWFGPIGADVFPPSHTFFIQDLPIDTVFPSGNFVSEDQFIFLEITSFPTDPTKEGLYRIDHLIPGTNQGVAVYYGQGGDGVTGTGSWRLWGANSDFLTEVRIVDEPTGYSEINRVLLQYLIDQIRPSSERVDLVYISFLDQFLIPDNLAQWDLTGSPSLPSPGGFVLLPAGDAMIPAKVFSFSWNKRSTLFKISLETGLTTLRLHGLYVDSNNSYIAQLSSSGQFLSLIKRLAGVDTLLANVVIPEMLPLFEDSVRFDLEYVNGGVFIRLKFNGDEILTYTDTTSPFLIGSLKIECVGGSAKIYHVEVLPLPLNIDRVGPKT